MEVIRCSRCGAFYVDGGYVCPNCTPKDNFELSKFKDFIDANGSKFDSLSQVASQSGISEKNLNRFLTYEGLEKYKEIFSKLENSN